MINGQFFKDALRDKKLTVRGLATTLGMKHHSQLSLTLSGKRRMQLDEAIELSKILGIPLNVIIANAGFPEVMQEGKRVPVSGALRGSGEVEDVPPNTERAIAPSGIADIAIAVQARTTETSLMWMDRFVFFCQEPAKPSDAIESRFCYLSIKNGPRVMATVRRGYNIGSYRLSGPYTAEDAVIEWAAPVIVTRN